MLLNKPLLDTWNWEGDDWKRLEGWGCGYWARGLERVEGLEKMGGQAGQSS